MTSIEFRLNQSAIDSIVKRMNSNCSPIVWSKVVESKVSNITCSSYICYLLSFFLWLQLHPVIEYRILIEFSLSMEGRCIFVIDLNFNQKQSPIIILFYNPIGSLLIIYMDGLFYTCIYNWLFLLYFYLRAITF